jgi:polysaccharide transporter, PST family
MAADRATTDPVDTGFTRASVRGSSWLLLSALVTSVLQLVSAAVLGRLLTPADFGVVAAALLVVRVVYYFSQFGLGSALVQKPALSDDDVRAAAWLAIVISSTATAGAVLAAPLMAALMHQPRSVHVAQILSLSFLLTGIATTPLALLRRHLRFRAVAVLEVSSYAIGYLIVGLAAVLAGAGLWSLVLAALAQSTVQALGALLLAPHPLSLRPPAGALAPLAGFGGRVSVVGFLEFCSLQLDTLGVARSRPVADLGQYTRGTLLAYPIVQVSLVVTRVLPSSFARLTDRARMQQAYRDTSVVLATGVLVAAAVLISGRDALVFGLLGRQWTVAAAILPWLAGASAFQALSQLPAVLCEARGVLRPKIWIQLVVLSAFASGVAVAVHAAAPVWTFGACWFGSELIRQSLYLGLLSRRFGLRIRAALGDLQEAAVPALLALLAVGVCDHVLGGVQAPDWLRLVAVLALGIAVPLATIGCRPDCRLRRIARRRHLVDVLPVGIRGRRLLTHILA